MNQCIRGISIEAIAACVPKNRVENSQFKYLLGEKELRKFEKMTGIKARRYAKEHVTASDLGFEAANKILQNKNCKNDIKAVIFLSQTSDYKIPFTSNILQDRLGLPKEILCLDINAGCAGFIQGLSVAYSILSTLSNGKVLLIVAETLSKILSKQDKSTTLLFGDGASAILINKDSSFDSHTYFNFNSDGKNSQTIKIEDGGYRNPFNEKSIVDVEDSAGNIRKKSELFMDGPKVFDFTLREIVPSIKNLLATYLIDINTIDYFLFHQSNKFIINQLGSKLGIPKSKIPINIQDFGNTSGVSIPLLMVTEKNRFVLISPQKIALIGYGVGLNWSNCIMNLSEKITIYDLIEV